MTLNPATRPVTFFERAPRSDPPTGTATTGAQHLPATFASLSRTSRPLAVARSPTSSVKNRILLDRMLRGNSGSAAACSFQWNRPFGMSTGRRDRCGWRLAHHLILPPIFSAEDGLHRRPHPSGITASGGIMACTMIASTLADSALTVTAQATRRGRPPVNLKIWTIDLSLVSSTNSADTRIPCARSVPSRPTAIS